MAEIPPPDVVLQTPPALRKKGDSSLSDMSRFEISSLRRAPILVSGKWENNRKWNGTFTIPSNALASDVKRLALSVMATSAAGTMLDSDVEKEGDQPDTRHSLLIGKDEPSIATSTASTFADSGCWFHPWTKLRLFPAMQDGNVRGSLTWPGVDAPITLEGRENTGHLLLKGSSKGFSEDAVIQSLRLDLQRKKKTLGRGMATPYEAIVLEGDIITSNVDGSQRDAIRIMPLYSPAVSISVVDANGQSLDSITPGSSLWIQAKGENTCPGVRDKMVLTMRVPSVPQPQNIVVVLVETEPDSGTFKSKRSGIVIHGNPGGGNARIFIEPESYAAMSSGSYGTNERDKKLYNMAGNVTAAIKFVNKSSPNEVKKTGKNPLMPNVSYKAMQVMDGVRSMIYYTPGKRRYESLESPNLVSIFRDDKHLIWSLWIKEKKYAEENMPPLPGSSEISRKELGRERVNGIDTTKYRIRSKLSNGADTEGLFWISGDGVSVKSQTSMIINGKERRTMIELSDIKIGPQKPSLFEIPKEFTVRTMNGMGVNIE